MKPQSLVLTSQHFIVFILVSYAVVVSLFLGSGLRNYLVIFAAMIGGILFIPFSLMLTRQIFWAFLLFFFMATQSYFLGGSGQLGSPALTLLYATGYFAVAGLLDRTKDKRVFLMKVMRWIILAFALLSAIQMLTSLAGLPVPNLIATKGLWSYNSLAYEPSHLGRVVGITMLCYLMLSSIPGEPDRAKTHRMVLIAFLTTMLLSGSSLAAVAILFVYGLSRSFTWLVLIALGATLMWPMALMINFEPLQRAILLASSLPSLDLEQVLDADHSGGIRFAPALIYLRDALPMEPGFWFGYGTEGIPYFFDGEIKGVTDDHVGAGFFPGFAVVYGTIAFALFVWIFVLRQANRTTLPLIVFWAIFMTTSAWNTQVFWYGLIIIQGAWAASRESTSPPGERVS